MTSKNFYRDANASHQAVFIFSVLAMFGLSIYLAAHYYATIYPQGTTSTALCDINSFLNCDVATFSPLAAIGGIPIAILGALLSVFLLAGYIFNSDSVATTNKLLLTINLAGCLVLFAYSLVMLKSLCPLCFFYYIASASALITMWRQGGQMGIGLIPCLSYGVIGAAVIVASYLYGQSKENFNNKKYQALIKSYNDLRQLGEPNFESDYRLVSAYKRFSDAPIRITKFSDFECPSCKVFSDILHKLVAIPKYRGKISVQYFFYPLDQACNPSMTRPIHQNACKAAYLASCLPNKFPQIERKIFASQRELSSEWIVRMAKSHGVEKCLSEQTTIDKTAKYIDAAATFNVTSTPTWLLNGRKIEGHLPLATVMALVDHLLVE